MSLLRRKSTLKTPRSTPSRKKTKSISSMLTLSLVLTIGTISIAMIATMYLYRVETAKKELNQQADELLVYLVGIVERPLWDMNEEDVATIGEVITRNELVNNVVIRDSFGKTIYRFERAPWPHLINRSGKVYHDQKFAGEVFLALNRDICTATHPGSHQTFGFKLTIGINHSDTVNVQALCERSAGREPRLRW